MLTSARLGTRDMERAKQFYDAVTGAMGAQRVMEQPNVVGYKGADGGLLLVGPPLEGEATVGNGSQIGFSVDSAEIVDTAYAKALEMGGTCAGPAGPRGNGAFYAAYFRDPDGNKLMVYNMPQA